jgi:hypothetical protein
MPVAIKQTPQTVSKPSHRHAGVRKAGLTPPSTPSPLSVPVIGGRKDGNITKALHRNPAMGQVIEQVAAEALSVFPGCRVALSFEAGVGVFLNIFLSAGVEDSIENVQSFRDWFTRINRATQGQLAYMFHAQ